MRERGRTSSLILHFVFHFIPCWFACTPTKYGIYDKMLALPWKMAKHLYSIASCVYTSIHIFPPPLFAWCVCMLFLRRNNNITSGCLSNATQMSRSSKLKSWLWWCLSLPRKVWIPLSHCRLLIADWKRWRKHRARQKNGLKITSHYALHTVTIIIIAAWPTTLLLTFLPAISLPPSTSYICYEQMTNSIGQEEKLPSFVFGVRAFTCVCVVVSQVKLLDFQEKWDQSVIHSLTTFPPRFWCMATKFNQQIWSVGGRLVSSVYFSFGCACVLLLL